VEERRQADARPIDHLKNRSAGRARRLSITRRSCASPLTATYRAPKRISSERSELESEVNLSEQNRNLSRFSANRHSPALDEH